MPFNNLAQKHILDADKTAIQQAVNDLDAAIRSHILNLTAKERQKMGNITKKSKLLISKVRAFRQSEPDLSSPDVNWDEYEADFLDTSFLNGLFNRVASISLNIKNAKILHEKDNYQNALTDYRYTKYKNSTEEAGYGMKQEELSQFFPNSGKKGGRRKASPPAKED